LQPVPVQRSTHPEAGNTRFTDPMGKSHGLSRSHPRDVRQHNLRELSRLVFQRHKVYDKSGAYSSLWLQYLTSRRSGYECISDAPQGLSGSCSAQPAQRFEKLRLEVSNYLRIHHRWKCSLNYTITGTARPMIQGGSNLRLLIDVPAGWRSW
jgi:hypothetical protein